MCVCSPETLIRDGELPKFNGKRITSIYAVYENSRYGTKKEGGGYVADILYYDCHVHDWDYKDWNGKRKGPAVLKVKKLPKEYDGMFGMVENKGVKVFVTSHWFRMRDSSNGSFTDQTLDMSGWSSNSTNGSFSLYRGIDYLQKPEKTFVIDEDSELHNKWKKILGHSFKVEIVEFADCGYKMEEGSLDFATKYPYPHTPIRIIDGLVYPDEKLPSWRWLFGMPYRVPDNKIAVLKHDKEIHVSPKSRESLRIWDDELKQHVFIEKAKDIEIGDFLISVSFSYEHHEIYGSKGDAYCKILRYIKEYGHEYVRHEVKKIVKDRETKKNKYVCDVYRNGNVVEKNKTYFGESFYRILLISASTQKEV
jgi:hypothetical protein